MARRLATMLLDEYGWRREIADCPAALIARLKHYFPPKDAPDAAGRRCEMTPVFDRPEAYEVSRRSREDDIDRLGDPEEKVAALLGKYIHGGRRGR